jgi:hypothetical protein
MGINELLVGLMKTNHDILEGTMESVTNEVAHWTPPGAAMPIGALYIHTLLSEDGMVNGLVRGQAPLAATTWAGKAGISEPPPADFGASWAEWAGRVKVDVGQARQFAQAVYASTEAYLSKASQAELDHTVDAGIPGLPPMPAAAFIANILSSHVAEHTGEISALKGEQGLKGYPF